MIAAGNAREPRSDAARNQQALVRAAIAAVHREGPRVPMATIAAGAGVGIGTLYRHFATREDLLGHLTHASFEQVLANAEAAEAEGLSGTDALRRFERSLQGLPEVRSATVREYEGADRAIVDVHLFEPTS